MTHELGERRFYISHPRRSREYLAEIDLIPARSGISMLICQGINMLRLHRPHPGACTHTNVRSATDITAGAPRRYEAMSGCRVGLDQKVVCFCSAGWSARGPRSPHAVHLACSLRRSTGTRRTSARVPV